jgi:hypothetical protein
MRDYLVLILIIAGELGVIFYWLAPLALTMEP